MPCLPWCYLTSPVGVRPNSKRGKAMTTNNISTTTEAEILAGVQEGIIGLR